MAIIVGTSLDDILNGTAGNDLIRGLAGNDVLNGGDGNDELDGGSGADIMNGGAGNDIYYVDNPGDVVNNDGGSATINTTINFNLSSVQGTSTKLNLFLRTNGITGTGSSGDDLILSYANNTTLIGGDGSDVLKGGTGSTLRGGNGNDILEITNGNTGVLRGGAGNDTYNVFNTNGNLVIDEYIDGGGIDTVFSHVDFSLSDGQPGVDFVASNLIENLTLAVLDGVIPGDKLGGPITGTGNIANNQIIGNRRDNFLYGLAGNDTIYASFGDDYIDGGSGNDSLYGEVGNDTLVGGTGADYMEGGIGNDTYFVDNAGDLVVEALEEGTDTVFVSATWSTDAEVENINVTGTNIVNITLTNTVGTVIDIDSSNTRNNIFIGGSGDDTMNGKVGIDSLTGGLGADTFEFGGAGLSVARLWKYFYQTGYNYRLQWFCWTRRSD